METHSYTSNFGIFTTSMMNNAVCKGEDKHFTIETYHSLHVRPHNILVDGESPHGENINIANF